MTCRIIAAVLSDALEEMEALVIFDQSYILHPANLFCAFWWRAEILRLEGTQMHAL